MLGEKIKDFFRRFFPKKDPAKLSRAQKREIWRKTWDKIRAIDKRS